MNYYNVIFSLVFLITTITQGVAQVLDSFSKERSFIEHLYREGKLEEAAWVLEEVSFAPRDSGSINFLKGKVAFRQKRLASSTDFLLKVDSLNRDEYFSARLLAAFNLLYRSREDSALEVLDVPFPTEGNLNDLRRLQMGASYLLKRDTAAFNDIAASYSYEGFLMGKAQRELRESLVFYRNMRTPSPALAGIFSTIIPGTGKIYAGKTGEGVANFLFCTIFGLQAWEAYRKEGLKSPYFIVYGGAFSVYYLANIFGSVISAKRVKKKNNATFRNKVFYNIHIPIYNSLQL